MDEIGSLFEVWIDKDQYASHSLQSGSVWLWVSTTLCLGNPIAGWGLLSSLAATPIQASILPKAPKGATQKNKKNRKGINSRLAIFTFACGVIHVGLESICRRSRPLRLLVVKLAQRWPRYGVIYLFKFVLGILACYVSNLQIPCRICSTSPCSFFTPISNGQFKPPPHSCFMVSLS